MGQATSSSNWTGQGLDDFRSVQHAQRYEELGDDHIARQRRNYPGASSHQSNTSRSDLGNGRNPAYRSTYRRETRARSTLISTNAGAEESEHHGRDDVVLEQEERPLILRDMEVRLNDAPITDIQAAPMPRRASMLSRIGSRVVRRSSNRHGATEEQRVVGGTGLGQIGISPRSLHPDADNPRQHRFSMFDLPTRSFTGQMSLPYNRRSSFSNTFSPSDYPTDPEAVNPPDSPARLAPAQSDRPTEADSLPDPMTSSHRARNLRRSLVAPLSHMFRSSRTRQQQRERPMSQRQELAADETTTLISPQATGTGTDVSSSDLLARSGRLSPGEEGSESNPVELESPDPPTSWLSSSRTSTDQPPAEGRRSSRRMQQLLGGRSSRLIRREDDTPLSRVLQLAAAAIAAQLSGRADSSPDIQSVGDDHFDGNLNAFIQSLNSAAEASADAETEEANMTSLPPLNFWRVFRFVNSNSNSNNNNTTTTISGNGSRDVRSAPSQNPPSQGESTASRLVTLVVVGVRSVPSSSLLGDTANAINSNLDGILSLPPTTLDGLNVGSSSNTDSPLTRNRLIRRRRTSFTGVNPLPSQHDGQRHHPSSAGRLNRTAALNPLRRSPATLPNNLSLRPPSPFPDDGRSNRPFLHVADSPSQTPASSTPSTSRDSTATENAAITAAPVDTPRISSIRQRPRSESHGHLGSGAARRNGVVEPDGAGGNGRHWLIYVVGTNLSEDHPAFQAPSLFTDNPSYEDMLMLSALLGPVKPPVASAQDVATAHGIFRLEIRRNDGIWMARTLDKAPGSDGVPSPLIEMPREVEQCLVCLTDYDPGEEVRQLQKCSHVFHRECIDTWLTTGRNSCPLCRGQGVDEKAVDAESPASVEAGAA